MRPEGEGDQTTSMTAGGRDNETKLLFTVAEEKKNEKKLHVADGWCSRGWALPLALLWCRGCTTANVPVASRFLQQIMSLRILFVVLI